MVILGSCVGMLGGAWTNFQLGIIRGPELDPPYAIIWPSYTMLGSSLLRLVIGLCIVVATRAIAKSVLYATLHSLILRHKEVSYLTKETTKEVLVELTYKYLSYIAIGFNVVYLAPAAFRFMNIERPTFHTEI